MLRVNLCDSCEGLYLCRASRDVNAAPGAFSASYELSLHVGTSKSRGSHHDKQQAKDLADVHVVD